MKLVTVFTAFSPADADLIFSRLEAANFYPSLRNVGAALAFNGYSLGVGGIKVEVPDSEVEEVKTFLADSTDAPAP